MPLLHTVVEFYIEAVFYFTLVFISPAIRLSVDVFTTIIAHPLSSLAIFCFLFPAFSAITFFEGSFFLFSCFHINLFYITNQFLY